VVFGLLKVSWKCLFRTLHEKLELLRYYYLWAKPVYGGMGAGELL